MKATAKYFWVVTALIVVQIGPRRASPRTTRVEGQASTAFPLAELAALRRDAHLAHAARGVLDRDRVAGDRPLHRAGRSRGHEPRFQRLGVNFLFVCLLVIVVGSLAGEWFAVQQKMGLAANFWFGHQGYEYVDLGRFWQIFLFVGLLLWLLLVGRALWPALKRARRQPLDHDAAVPLDRSPSGSSTARA